MSKVPYVLALASSAMLGSVLACTAQQDATPAAADGGAGADAAAGTGTLSCLAILQCIADCPTNDTACADACVAKGSADGVTKASALADCITKQGCTEATCVQGQCKPSLDACVTSSAPTPTGTPLQGTAPAGDVPADLVGSWARANYGQTTRVVLNADGTGTYQVAISSLTTGCTSTSSSSQTGNAVVTGDTITIYATDVQTTQKICSSPLVTTPGSSAQVVLRYTHPDPSTLNIVDATCAAKYPDSPSSASLYCAEVLTKE